MRAPRSDSIAAGTIIDVVAHWRLHRNRVTSPSDGIPTKTPLGRALQEQASSDQYASQTFSSFLRVCLCFGLAQGAIMTTVTYATTFMGERAGSYCDGFFFGSFTITSFLFAETILAASGGALLAYKLAIKMFLVYQLSLALSYHMHVSGAGGARTLAYTASLVGGMGFSLHWTAQSLLYREASAAYAAARRLDVEKLNTTFSGLFAAIYVPFEMACKQLASVVLMSLPHVNGGTGATADTQDVSTAAIGTSSLREVDVEEIDAQVIVWARFFALFVVVVGLAAILARPLGVNTDSFSKAGQASDEGEELSSLLGKNDAGQHSASGSGARSSFRAIFEKLTDTPRMLWESQVLMALMPINIAFGICAGFLFTFFYDKTVAKYRGDSAVGFCAAVGSAVCAVSALPLSMMAASIGKGPVVLLGAFCFGSIGAAYLALDNSVIGSWAGVLTIQILMGVGRGVWENTNKVVCLPW